MYWHSQYIKLYPKYASGSSRYQRGADGVEFTESIFSSEARSWWLPSCQSVDTDQNFAYSYFENYRARYSVPRDEWEFQDYLIIAKYEIWYRYNITHHSMFSIWLDDITFKSIWNEFLNKLAYRIVNSNEEPLEVFFEYSEEYFEGEL